MNEADRVAKQRAQGAVNRQIASANAQAAEEASLRRSRTEAIRRLVPEILQLLKTRGYPGIELRRVEVPRPFSSMFGYRTEERGGWPIAQIQSGDSSEAVTKTIYLLSSGGFQFHQAPEQKIEDVEYHHAKILAGLTALRDRLAK